MGKFVTVFEWRMDEPFRTFTDGCCGTIRAKECGGDKYILEVDEDVSTDINRNSKYVCKVIGDLFEENGYGSAAGRVYDSKALAPCLGAAHFSQIKYILVRK